MIIVTNDLGRQLVLKPDEEQLFVELAQEWLDRQQPFAIKERGLLERIITHVNES